MPNSVLLSEWRIDIEPSQLRQTQSACLCPHVSTEVWERFCAGELHGGEGGCGDTISEQCWLNVIGEPAPLPNHLLSTLDSVQSSG